MSDRLGTARWEEPPVVGEKYPFADGTFWLGRAVDGSAIGYRDDRHVCLVSGSRGGKGTSVIVNNLCFWPGSAVVIDPKGENATVTAARRGRGAQHCEGLGQAVHVLDPFKTAVVDDSYRSSFNPLDALDPEREETIDEAARLANAIVVVRDESADPFWDESARSLIRGIILHVLTAPEFDYANRNLITVRNLISRGEYRIAKAMRAMGKEVPAPHQLLWRAMEDNPAFDGIVAGIGSRFLSMMTASPKTFESVLQAAALHTEFLDSPGMRSVLAKSDFDLAELKASPKGMTLYLCLPQRYIDTHYRWLRMMVVLTTTEMEVVRGRPATGYPVLMVLDEFAGLKRMTAIESAVAQIAGFGVKLFFVLQSLEQLKHTYKDNWETFLSNAGVKIFFSIEDHFTREYVSKLAGETEIIREVQSTNESSAENESYAEGQTRSETLSTSETRGKSQSLTDGTSASRTLGTSRSVNESRTEGTSQSRSTTETFGSGQSIGWSFGSSNSHGGGSTYGPGAGGYSSNHSFGSTSSISKTVSENHSIAHGNTDGRSSSVNRGTTDGTSRSDTEGRSESRTEGTSSSATQGSSNTSGTSETRTKGTSRTAGTGRSETVHRRPLVQPDEVGRMFGRIDDRSHPIYPGFALVMVTGGNPFIIRRVHYFEDPLFIDCFSPHPDHRFLPAAANIVEGIRPLIRQLEAAREGIRLTIARWFIEPGKPEIAGQVAATIDRVPPDNRTVRILVPCAGKVTEVAGGNSIPDSALFTVKSYLDVKSGIDPFQELREACRELEQLQQKQVVDILATHVQQPKKSKLSAEDIIFHILFWVVGLAIIVFFGWKIFGFGPK